MLSFEPLLVHDRYAKLEKGLGEIDRARAIYVHASVMADPRRDPGYWADWNAFEVTFCLVGKTASECNRQYWSGVKGALQ